MDPTKKTCPACQGRRVLSNPQTGNPATCPLCEGDGEVDKKIKRTLYDFVFPPLTVNSSVPATAQGAVSLKVTTDFDLEIWDIVANPTSWSAQVRLEINATGFMNTTDPGNQNGIDLANWAGTGTLPYSRRWPFVIHRGDQVALYLTDLSSAPNRIAIAFKGFQLVPLE